MNEAAARAFPPAQSLEDQRIKLSNTFVSSGFTTTLGLEVDS